MRFIIGTRSNWLALVLLLLAGDLLLNLAVAEPLGESTSFWRKSGAEALQQALRETPIKGAASNVILFIGDGMSIATVTAARILDGQLQGNSGEENTLSFERMPYLGLAKTYNSNQQTPDSAGTMSAIMTGVKTRAGVLGLGPENLRRACTTVAENTLDTLLWQFERQGRSTGIVTTARLTHATPAATYASSPERDWESDADLSPAARDNGCRDIAQQLLDTRAGDGIDVALGGGRGRFFPIWIRDPESGFGSRLDGRDLTREWTAKGSKSHYVWSAQQLSAVDADRTDKLLGLFSPTHMPYRVDNTKAGKQAPSLAAMTEKAIALLRKNPAGFFLMVEGGRIDHAHHQTNAYRALTETIELARAVDVARALTDRHDTLIVVTADHGHVLSLAGYPTRGNPILGKVRGNRSDGRPQASSTLASDGKPYTTLSYHNGPGAEAERGPQFLCRNRTDLTATDTEHPDYQQQTALPLDAETHSSEDVAIYTEGPWAHLFRGTIEQHVIYFLMHYASLGQKHPVDD